MVGKADWLVSRRYVPPRRIGGHRPDDRATLRRMEREGFLGRLRWRWQRSETRHRLVWRSGLQRLAAGSGSTLLHRWAERESVIFQYVFLRRLVERRRERLRELTRVSQSIGGGYR